MTLQACCDLCDNRKPDFPRTETIIKNYVLEKLARNEPFYISAELNSDTVKPDPGFGLPFLIPLVAAAAGVVGSVAAVAAPIAAAVAPLASVAGTALAVNNIVNQATAGSPQQQSQSVPSGPITINPQFESQVVADLQAKGIQLPSAIKSQTISAASLDLFGPGSGQWVILGGFMLMVLLLAMK